LDPENNAAFWLNKNKGSRPTDENPCCIIFASQTRECGREDL